jgi:hypothetical protein
MKFVKFQYYFRHFCLSLAHSSMSSKSGYDKTHCVGVHGMLHVRDEFSVWDKNASTTRPSVKMNIYNFHFYSHRTYRVELGRHHLRYDITIIQDVHFKMQPNSIIIFSINKTAQYQRYKRNWNWSPLSWQQTPNLLTKTIPSDEERHVRCLKCHLRCLFSFRLFYCCMYDLEVTP